MKIDYSKNRVGHIDEVCWLFSVPHPSPEQFKQYDKLLSEQGWDCLGIDDLDEAQKEVLRDELAEGVGL
ncbi:MAG: hypothetical protein H8D67_23010 [Deltaproteobacteria bacterium]|nr:hypothetical protein [Deltaproteobacteria bacterium]